VSSRFSGKLRTSEEGADTIVWLATQPKEKMVSGAFYFDRAEAPKHLMLAATGGSHGVIDAIVDSLRSLSSLSSSS
jgi:dehydrogenase/reductase SDR family protein 12